jgi:small-conductance mechanosensitive channel
LSAHSSRDGLQQRFDRSTPYRNLMNNLIYIVGLIVVIVAVLSFFGLR